MTTAAPTATPTPAASPAPATAGASSGWYGIVVVTVVVLALLTGFAQIIGFDMSSKSTWWVIIATALLMLGQLAVYIKKVPIVGWTITLLGGLIGALVAFNEFVSIFTFTQAPASPAPAVTNVPATSAPANTEATSTSPWWTPFESLPWVWIGIALAAFAIGKAIWNWRMAILLPALVGIAYILTTSGVSWNDVQNAYTKAHGLLDDPTFPWKKLLIAAAITLTLVGIIASKMVRGFWMVVATVITFFLVAGIMLPDVSAWAKSTIEAAAYEHEQRAGQFRTNPAELVHGRTYTVEGAYGLAFAKKPGKCPKPVITSPTGGLKEKDAGNVYKLWSFTGEPVTFRMLLLDIGESYNDFVCV